MLSASAAYLDVADKGKRNTPPGQVPCPARTSVHVPCKRRITPSSLKRRFAKRIEPRIARRGSLIMCIQKCTINPVSNQGQRIEPGQWRSTAQAMPTPPAVPSPLWTPPQPRHPPRQVTPKGGKGTLRGSCCCGPSLPCFASLWQKTLAAMIEAIAASGHNGLRHTLCFSCSRFLVLIPPPTRQSVTDCGLYPSRTQDAARACAGLPPIRPPRGLPDKPKKPARPDGMRAGRLFVLQ